jgi:hypothetical protein
MDPFITSHLFSNFFVAFSRAFGCTLPPPPLPNTNGPVQLAYAHKFMNLEYHQLGYFINQLSLAATHFGVLPQDADTFRTTLNSRYNVRCAQAVSFNPSSPPQLLSLCQNPTCPLAVPVSDCAAYANLTAGGVVTSNPTTVTSFATKTATPSSPGELTSTTASAASTASGKLGTGGIAGVAIGGAAVVLIAVIALVFILRRRRTPPAAAPDNSPAAAWSQQDYGSSTIHPSSSYLPKNPHVSYYSTGQPPSEMDTSRYPNHADTSSSIASPDLAAYQTYRPHSGHPSETWSPPPVEMEGALPANSSRGPSPSPRQAVWQDSHRTSDSTPVQRQEHYGQQHWGRSDRHSGL